MSEIAHDQGQTHRHVCLAAHSQTMKVLTLHWKYPFAAALMQQKRGCASERTVENPRFQRIYGADDFDRQKGQGCNLLKEFAFFTGEAIFQYMATRSPGQKLIPVPAKEQFINRLNSGVKKAGYSNRSQFIRDAIVEKLENHGVKLPGNLAEPPARTWQRKVSKPKAPVGKKARKRK